MPYKIVLRRPGAAALIIDRSCGLPVGTTEDFARIFKLISDATFRTCAFPGTLVANGYGPHESSVINAEGSADLQSPTHTSNPKT